MWNKKNDIVGELALPIYEPAHVILVLIAALSKKGYNAGSGSPTHFCTRAITAYIHKVWLYIDESYSDLYTGLDKQNF